MEYLNQAVLILSHQNQELKQKNAKLQKIYKKITNFQQKQKASHQISQNNQTSQNSELIAFENIQEISKLSQQTTKLKSELSKMAIEFSEVQKQTLQLMHKNHQLQKQIKKLIQNSKRSDLKNQCRLNSTIQIWKQKLEEAQGQIQHQYKKKLIQKQYEIQEYSDKIRSLSKKLQQADDKNNQYHKLITGLQQSQKYYQKSLKQYETLMKTIKNSHITQKAELQKNIKLLEEQNAQIQKKLKLKTKIQYELLTKIDQMCLGQKLLVKQNLKLKKQLELSQKEKQRQLLRERSISKTALASLETHKKYTTLQITKAKLKQKIMQKSQQNLIQKVKELSQKQATSKSPHKFNSASSNSLSFLNISEPVIPKNKREQSTKSTKKSEHNNLQSKRNSQNQLNSLSLIDERYRTRKSSEQKSVKQFQDDINQDQLHNYSSIQLKDCFPSSKTYKKHCKNGGESPNISHFDLDSNINFDQNLLSPEYHKISPFKTKMNGKKCYLLEDSHSINKKVIHKVKPDLYLNTAQIQKQSSKFLKLSDLQTPSFQSGKFNFNNHFRFADKETVPLVKKDSSQSQKNKRKILIKSKK